MKLAYLLASIGALWCVLGAIVLGPGILVYPVAWAAVFAVLFGIHKVFDRRSGHSELASSTHPNASSDATTSQLPQDHPTAFVR